MVNRKLITGILLFISGIYLVLISGIIIFLICSYIIYNYLYNWSNICYYRFHFIGNRF